MTEPWIEEYKREGLTLAVLNKLVTSHRKINKHNKETRYIIQIGKKELDGMQHWTFNGFGIQWDKYDINKKDYEIVLDVLLNTEIEQVDKDSYLWIKEKL